MENSIWKILSIVYLNWKWPGYHGTDVIHFCLLVIYLWVGRWKWSSKASVTMIWNIVSIWFKLLKYNDLWIRKPFQTNICGAYTHYSMVLYHLLSKLIDFLNDLDNRVEELKLWFKKNKFKYIVSPVPSVSSQLYTKLHKKMVQEPTWHNKPKMYFRIS